ncbi:MAG TPA: DoxX family protein [Thermoanaerobaculia bacterium]|nr:DoxX family protein [Thermoanaerobaculia bacterium]
MLKKLMQTDEDVGMLIVRLTLGLVMFPHGAQKLLGWFGGPGFAGAMQFFTSKVGLPAVVAFLVILAEFFGAIALISGFLGRVGAFGVLCVMLGAIFKVHLENGFFMNWYNNPQQGEGYEYHLLAIGMALAILVKGSGSLSIDRSMSDKERRTYR